MIHRIRQQQQERQAFAEYYERFRLGDNTEESQERILQVVKEATAFHDQQAARTEQSLSRIMEAYDLYGLAPIPTIHQAI